MLPRETLRRPTFGQSTVTAYLHNHQPLWLSIAGWGLGHVCLGALLFDFQASPVIWLLLGLSSLIPFVPRWRVPYGLQAWSPGLTLGLAFIGMAIPEWALFLMALPMGILFVSLTLTGNQPVKASLINSLAVFGGSTLFISLVIFCLGMSRGEHLTLLTALLPFSIAALTLPLCTVPLGRFSRRLASGGYSVKWSLGIYGAIVSFSLALGAWMVQSSWTIALVAPELVSPLP